MRFKIIEHKNQNVRGDVTKTYYTVKVKDNIFTPWRDFKVFTTKDNKPKVAEFKTVEQAELTFEFDYRKTKQTVVKRGRL